jgi:hypothetical protein
MASEFEDQYGDDPEMSRLLRERLPRHPAPARLRAAVARALKPPVPRPGWGAPWLAPALSALATALVMVMWMVPSLPRTRPADPIQPLVRAVLTDHSRTIIWGESRPDVVPAALPRVMEESGVMLNWVFTGDHEIQLVDARPTYLEGARGLELVYKDVDGHTVTYVIMPGGNVALPEAGRVQIDRWRPVVRTESGFSLILWKQQGLLCVLVSDLVSPNDLARFKEYFVKVRSSTEPFSIW